MCVLFLHTYWVLLFEGPPDSEVEYHENEAYRAVKPTVNFVDDMRAEGVNFFGFVNFIPAMVYDYTHVDVSQGAYDALNV